MSYLTYQQDEGFLRVYFENGVFLGVIVNEVHGEYVFYPELNGGYWQGYVLRIISDKLEEMNKENYEPIL